MEQKKQYGTQLQQTVRYLIGLLLYGTNGVAASLIHKTSLEIVFLRTALGCALLSVIFYGTGGRLRRESKKNLLFTALSGAAMGIDWLLLFEAYDRIGVSLGVIINYCGPVLVMIAVSLFWKEKLSKFAWAALALAMTGAIMVSWQASFRADGVGLLCAVCSAFAYAAMVLLKRQAAEFSGLGSVVLQLASAFVTVLIYAGTQSGINLHIAAGELGAVLWLGLINTGAASYLYFTSIGTLPVREVSVLGYLEPLSALVFSALILRETMQPVQILGAALILGGTAVVELSKKDKR